MSLRIPPGRMGRLWLRERLAVAARAADLLEQKRRALRSETERLGQLVEDTRTHWEATCRAAETWLLRAAVVGGERQFEVATAHLKDASEAVIVWHSTMGLAYPWEADCILAEPVDVAGFGETAALPYAIEAHRAALVAAVEHAAAQRAFELVSKELEVTTWRLRAIEKRWIPRLESALREVEQRLEDRDREDVVRARRAAQRRAARQLQSQGLSA
jgi:V/A-type H+-transporting ATPase subunit D